VREGKFIWGAQHFWVFNTHFQLEESVKTNSCRSVLWATRAMQGVGTWRTEPEPFIVCGDLNFFPDRDGALQRAILTEDGGLRDLGTRMLALSDGRELRGTFVGFDHDDFKADLANMVSRLDHVLLWGPQLTAAADHLLVYDKTMLSAGEPAPFSTRSYPSDHLPLLARLTLRME